MNNDNAYIPRLIDKKVEKYLQVFGAVSIEGPKWCGKTVTSSNHANSITYMDEKNNQDVAKTEVNAIFSEERPQLIDEWHLVPEIWDAVRRECDKTNTPGNFILTGSSSLPLKNAKKKVHHSGIGRIGKIKMSTMSLYESLDSTGKVSIMDMYNGKFKNGKNKEVTLKELAKYIVRGGWPGNLNISDDKIDIIPKSYINSILDDLNEDNYVKRDKQKMQMLLRSLARNETSMAGNLTIIKDIFESEKQEDLLSSRETLSEYLDDLNRLHLIENQEAYDANYRSRERVGKTFKRHFTDPSLACACLNLNVDRLLKDLNTFGLLFESLVERDLRIYMDYLDGNLYQFRDNISGLEIDSILEFSSGEYGAVEIKLGMDGIEEAKKNLLKFYDNMITKPKFMCIIVGVSDVIMKDPETGIYIVPVTALKP